MARAISPLITGSWGALIRRKDFRSRTKELDLVFTTRCKRVILKTKPQAQSQKTRRRNPQQDLYRDLDVMWKNATPGQLKKWTEYYYQELEAGRAENTRKKKKRCSGQDIEKKVLSKRGLFMKKGLSWDLKEFLEDWLKTKFSLESVFEGEKEILVELRLMSQEEEDEMFNAMERNYFRGRG